MDIIQPIPQLTGWRASSSGWLSLVLLTVYLSLWGEANLGASAAGAKLGSAVYRREDGQAGQRELQKIETRQ